MVSMRKWFKGEGACAQVPARSVARGTSLALLVGLAAGVGCATTSADFRLSEVTPDEGAIAGRLTIIYKGQAFTENCRAMFGGKALQLAVGGIVLFHVKKGWTELDRLECQDGSNQHVQIKGARFFTQGDGWVSDFGDVVITWETEGGFKVSSMFGLLGAIIDEASDDGRATVEVSSPAPEVREAFRRQTGVEGRWVVSQLTRPGDRTAFALAPNPYSNPDDDEPPPRARPASGAPPVAVLPR